MNWFDSVQHPQRRSQPHDGSGRGLFQLTGRRCLAAFILLFSCAMLMQGCGLINPGKFKWIEKTGRGEEFYLVKDIFMTPGSSNIRKESFDHVINETVNLVFIPREEKNHYIAESIWYDPSENEFRTVRATYDKQQENKTGFERVKGGTPRIHTMPTKELYNHKPGLWKVALYLEGKLVRTLRFTVM
jgi:hypothetical protein